MAAQTTKIYGGNGARSSATKDDTAKNAYSSRDFAVHKLVNPIWPKTLAPYDKQFTSEDSLFLLEYIPMASRPPSDF